jgi:hypothetical protein
MAKKIPKIVKDIKKFQKLETDYRYEKTISYSQLSMYRTCAYKWKLQYKDGNYIYAPSIHFIFGTAMHETIQQYLTSVYDENYTVADNLDLEDIFETKLRDEYASEYKKNNKTHFSSPEELREFYEDGLNILSYLKKNKKKYFSKRGWFLVGCEVPISLRPNKLYNNVIYNGYLDLVLYHEPTNTFTIIDFKTSTRGWNDMAKKDEDKQFQLILYKQFFAEQFNLDVESIDINFMILKRKINEEAEFVQRHIQEFKPASGKIKIGKALNAMNEFISNCFQPDGIYKEIEHKATPSPFNCKYCQFSSNNLCSYSIS